MKNVMYSVGAAVGIGLWIVAGASFGAEGDPGKFDKPETFAVDVTESTMVHAGVDVKMYVNMSGPLNKEWDAASKGFILKGKGLLKDEIKTYYQWRRDGTNYTEKQEFINPKQSALKIESVDHTNAGSYTMLLTGAIERESYPIHLSVYSTGSYESFGGKLTEPLGSFIGQTPIVPCTLASPAATGGFNYYKVFQPFYGRAVQNQQIPFNNPGYSKLAVDTCTNSNPNIDTLIVLHRNIEPLQEVACNDQFDCQLSPPKPNLSKVIPYTLVIDATYRVTIWVKSTGQPTGNLTLKWLYRN